MKHRDLQYREDPDIEAGVQQGRHGDGRQFLLHFGRRRRAHRDERGGGTGARLEAPRPRPGVLEPRPRAGVVHHGPGRSDKETLAKLGWRPHDADLYEINEAFAAVPMAAMHDLDIDRAGERQWGRLRARPSDRRDGRSYLDDPPTYPPT